MGNNPPVQSFDSYSPMQPINCHGNHGSRMRPTGRDEWMVMGRTVDLNNLTRGIPPRMSTTLLSRFPYSAQLSSLFGDGVEFASLPETSTLVGHCTERAGDAACVAFTPTTEFLP